MQEKKWQNKDVDLLIEALEKEDFSNESLLTLDLNQDVVDFLNANNLKEGEHRIRLYALYNHYRTWSNKPLNLKEFSRIISRYFCFDDRRGEFIKINIPINDVNKAVIKKKQASSHLKKGRSYIRHIKDFIKEMEIKESDNWVDYETVYKWYIRWRYQRKFLKLSKPVFKNVIKFHFEHKQGKQKLFLKLNGNFTKEKIMQLRGNNEEEKQEIENQELSTET